MPPIKCSLKPTRQNQLIKCSTSVLTLERISGEAGSHHSEISNCHFPRYTGIGTRAFTRPWYPCRHGARCVPGGLGAMTDSRSQARHCGREAPPPTPQPITIRPALLPLARCGLSTKDRDGGILQLSTFYFPFCPLFQSRYL